MVIVTRVFRSLPTRHRSLLATARSRAPDTSCSTSALRVPALTAVKTLKDQSKTVKILLNTSQIRSKIQSFKIVVSSSIKMPRRRTDEEVDCHITLKSNGPVSDYLKNSYFDLLVKTNTKLQCPICLEEDLLCCKNCFCLLNCGHAMHLHEYLKISKCPVCRK